MHSQRLRATISPFRASLFGLSLIGACLLASTSGFAARNNSSHERHPSHDSLHIAAHHGGTAAGHRIVAHGGRRSSGGLQCVPFARAASGIALKGNAVNWWDAAAGIYERGNRPEAGAVLNFRANGNMRLGHVAVVTRVLDSRTVEIDHANWAGTGRGGVARSIPVIDVSERNDWSAVRVALGHGSDFGSVYPTYGFIYDRPDHGTMVANDFSGAHSAARGGYDEVAEAPDPAEAMPERLTLEPVDRAIR
jgi:hypothetical protein